VNVLLVTLQQTLDVMGLKYIHQYLLENGHRSVLLHLPRFRPENERDRLAVEAFVREVCPGLVGVSLMAVEHKGAKVLTAQLRRALPGVPIVWGGIHPTTAPEVCLEHADYVCLGEGERATLDMANALDHGESLREVRNLCYRENGQVKANPLHPLIKDLDALPFPRQIPPNSFVLMDGRVEPTGPKALQRFMRYGTAVYNVVSSRGCPYRCAYCSNSCLHKLYPDWGIRRRSVSSVIAELEQAVQDFPGLTYVNFQDDCFLACDMGYLAGMCHEFRSRIGKGIIAKSTPTYVTRERIALLKEAGLRWFNMGLQSGSERICQDVYHRRSLPKHFLAAAQLLHEYGIAPWYDVIVDNPFETLEDHYETVETLMATPRPFYPQIFSLTLYWGTDLRERAERECPDEVGEPFESDFYVYHKRPINDLIEVATTFPVPLTRRLLAVFKRNPTGLGTRLLVSLAKAYCRLVLRPITYLRVIRVSQGGSLWKTFQILPMYFRVGFSVYLGLFKSAFKRN